MKEANIGGGLRHVLSKSIVRACSCCLLLISPTLLLADQPLQHFMLDQKNQTNVQLTLYHQFGVVRDTRQVVLPKGKIIVEYKDVAQTLNPTSVFVSNPGKNRLNVLEQSYRYDLLNRSSLLETYIGRKLKYSRSILQGENYEKILREGILLSISPEIVDFGDEIEISPEGVISLPDVPDGLTLSPTLVWLIENQKGGEQIIDTRYVADGISWQADYVLSLDELSKTANISSWATVSNNTGTVFKDASIKLIAGSVNKIHESQPKTRSRNGRESMMLSAASDSMGIENTQVNAYQAFNLPNRTTLLNHETKQIKFIQAESVAYQQTFRLQTQLATYLNARLEKPAVMSELSFNNAKANQLGMPLPSGNTRTYSADGDLLGEARLTSVPVGQEVVLQLGRAFDLTATRTQQTFTRLNDRSFEVGYEITLDNARSENAKVVVDESMQGDWDVQESSEAHERINSQVARFTVVVPGNGSKTIYYRVKVRL